MITQKLDLNLIPGRVLPMVNVSQYDKDSRTLEFTIYNGDASFDLTGLSAYIQGLKPDGHGFNYSATISSGKITVDVTEQMTVVAGRVMCEVVLLSGTDRIGTGNFVLNVEAAAMPDGSNISDSDYSYIEQLIENAQEAESDAEAWAVGERGGVPVGPTDPTYENSAKYWAQQASGSVNDMTGATASTPGAHGLVPAPDAGDQDKVLHGDGTWRTPSGGSDMTGATAGAAGTHGLVPAPAAGDQDKFLGGDGTWKNPPAGGHTIQNPSGTDMTQRAKLQFAGTGVSVTDDSVNNKTVVQFTGGGGGLLPHIVITSEAGATVTLVNGGTTISATETSTGIFEADIPSFGTWTITVLDGGQTYTQTIVIDTVKIYTATVTAFSATILVTYPSGATCTCTGNGQSYTASGTPYTFTVHSTGTYTITVTMDGVSKTDTMVITEDGQASAVTIKFGTINLTLANEFVGLSISCVSGGTSIAKTAGSTSLTFRPPTTGTWTISGTVNGVTYSTDATVSDLDTAVSASLQTLPDGSTVTPTDDIQTWLHCAGIMDKAYTTLAEVLADSTTLLALISDNNAVDYLVRSKTFIGNSEYIPVMTSDTTPSGVASSSGAQSGYEAYKAFDRVDRGTNSGWQATSGSQNNSWLQYEFDNPVLIDKIVVDMSAVKSAASYWRDYIFNLKASNDGTNFTTLASNLTVQFIQGTSYYLEASITSETPYKYYRFETVQYNCTYGGGYAVAFGIQLSLNGICQSSAAMTDIGANNYAADTLLADSDWCTGICNSSYFESVLNVKVPTLSSNANCIYQDINASYQAYYAFDGNNTTFYNPSAYPTPEYIGYDFGKDVAIFRIDMDVDTFPTYTIQYSDDNSTWTDATDTLTGADYGVRKSIKEIISGSSHRYWRANRVDTTSQHRLCMYEMQMYGREDV